MVPFVLCFGVDFLCCLNLMYVFISFYLSLGNLVTAYREIAIHSAYDMFSKYKNIMSISVFPPRFLELKFSSDSTFC